MPVSYYTYVSEDPLRNFANIQAELKAAIAARVERTRPKTSEELEAIRQQLRSTPKQKQD